MKRAARGVKRRESSADKFLQSLRKLYVDHILLREDGAIVVAEVKDADRRIAIALGAVGAVAASYAGERLRVTAAGKVPDTLVALLEDLVAFTLGSNLAPDA